MKSKINNIENKINERLTFCRQNFYKKLNENEKNLIKLNTDNTTENFNINKFKNFDCTKIQNKYIGSKEDIKQIEFSYSVFNNCTFKEISFINCEFKNVLFNNCKFENVNFINSNFYEDELITIFDGNCFLEKVKFINCDLENSMFLKTKIKDIYLENTNLKYSIFKNINISNIKIKDCDLRETKFLIPEIIDLKFVDDKNTKIDEYFFLDNLVVNTNYKKSFDDVSRVYKAISSKFEDNNYYDLAGEYNYLYKLNKGKSLYGLERFKSNIFWLICGYGERPTFALITSIEIILIFSLIYMFSGLNISGSILNYEMMFTEGIFREGFIKDFCNCLYFSVATFTTVGYGDITPVGLSIFLSAIEMFLGLTMTGIWTATFARKIIR